MSENTLVWIDDRDPRVKFNGVWPVGGSASDFHSTLSSSTRVGDSFTLTFWGQSVIVYGLIDATSEGVVTNYSIDGAPAQQVTSQRGVEDTPRQQFWSSPVLNITQHELTVTMAKISSIDPTPGEGTVWFDYFAVNDPSGHEGRTPQRLSKGAIAGIVVGAVAFVVLVALLVAWWVKRRRERREEEEFRRAHFSNWTPPEDNKEFNEGAVVGNHFDRDPRGRVGRSSPWAFGTSQQSMRNGIQPFVLGISPPLHADPYDPEQGVYLPRPAPVVLRDGDRKRGMPTGSTSVRVERPTSSLQSSTAPDETCSPTTTVVGTWQAEIAPAVPPSAAIRLTHNPSPSFALSSIESENDHSSEPVSRVTALKSQTSRRTISDEPELESFSEQGREGNSSRDQGAATLVTGARAPEAHSSPGKLTSGSRRPIIRVVIADSGLESEESGNSGRRDSRLVQHVDSGMRLVPETRRSPIELPPVYSPT